MKKLLILFTGIMLVLALAGCGQKSQEDVIAALDEKIKDSKGYKVQAKMSLQMGSNPQVYNVEIWHKNPSFYRVNLKNEAKDQSQMILRNNEGVFVLTPALNKSFKFQSEWPENSSQAYLYESLVKDIKEDKSATFKATDNHYIFETKTRYQNNKMLPTQEITLNKKDLSPVSVKVMDPDKNVLVHVEFKNMKFNSSFDKDAFDMKKNMTSAQLDIDVMGMGETMKDRNFAVKYPEELYGISLVGEKKMETEDGERVVLTYEGEKSFTLIQEKAKVMQASVSMEIDGEPVDLGYTVGAISGKMLTWSYEGVDYTLASQNLSPEEMVEIAKTVGNEGIK